MKKEILCLRLYEWLYIFFWAILISILSFFNNSSIFAVISCLLGMFATIFNMKNNRIAFIFYILYVSSYGTISLINHNYGEGILNLFYNTPLYIFTVYKLFFAKDKVQSDNDKIKSLNLKEWIIILLLIPLVTLIYGYILSRIENSNLPYINALATGFAATSSFLASKRCKDQWIFWMGYSFSLIYIWMFSNGERVYLFLNIFYIVNNAIGIYLWNKKYKEQRLISNN